jgi:hypothetical protein
MNNTTNLGTWWASLALVNAGLAQAEGRSRWYWFLFALFLGPLATLFIVVWPPLSRTETKKATETSASTRTAIATEDRPGPVGRASNSRVARATRGPWPTPRVSASRQSATWSRPAASRVRSQALVAVPGPRHRPIGRP